MRFEDSLMPSLCSLRSDFNKSTEKKTGCQVCDKPSFLSFQTQIYFASEEYGLDSVVTCGGYFLMADVFVKMDNMAVAHSLYSEVKKNLCHNAYDTAVFENPFIFYLPSD